MEQKGEKPKFDVTFEQAKPTLTHRAILALEAAGKCLVQALAYNVLFIALGKQHKTKISCNKVYLGFMLLFFFADQYLKTAWKM